ncbi:hypothetical protein AMTRI_Chr07g24060 [Amborella trichopoda]
MAFTKSLVSFVLFSLFVSAFSLSTETRSQESLREARQCRIDRIPTSRPARRIQSEGGHTEIWDEYEDQFLCAGVAAIRNTIHPNSLSLPNFEPAPRLVYIQKGRGIISIVFPGCTESFQSQGYIRTRVGGEGQQQQGIKDRHQKVQTIKQGDAIAIPAGAAHWCYNDGSEDLIAFSITDVTNDANQIEQSLKSFYLAGGQPRRGQEEGQQEQEQEQERQNSVNVINELNAEQLAEAFAVPIELIRSLQKPDERGWIVRVEKESLGVIRPDEEEEERERYSERSNGYEERECNARIRQNIDNPRRADIYSRQAGHIQIVNRQTLPILSILDMSIEKGHLHPNALYAPHWTINAHTIVLITRGEGNIQVIGTNGRKVMDDRVHEGDVFVIPQYFTAMSKAGNEGLEWVAIKTSDLPMKSPILGHASAIKGIPIEVLKNAYKITTQEARDIKLNRKDQYMLLPPRSTSSRP